MGTKIRNVEVGNRIGEAPKFRIYSGETEDKQKVIIKVAKTFEDGDHLAEEASKFNILGSFTDHLESLEQSKSMSPLRYDWLFARLNASFLEPSQGDRRINIFSIPDIDMDVLIPLTKLSKETEIDSRSSIWILGRFLKFYSLHELMSCSGDNPVANYPLFSSDDYLIGPKDHRLIYYNFSGEMADVVAFEFVKAIAKFILEWFTPDDTDEDQKYRELLEDFSAKGRFSVEQAHLDLYDLVESLWGYKYHPFTYRERNTTIWKTIKEN